MSEPLPVLEVRGLRKVYVSRTETVEILQGVALTVGKGVTVVISGESGCGKTTLLNLLGGLDHPTSGSVTVEGKGLWGLAEEELGRFRNRYLGFIFQFHYLLKDFTALENVLIPARIAGQAGGPARRRALELLDDVGLADRARHLPSELSGGERQRVAVARALMNDPTLILADEPTGNLDERNAAGVADILFGLMARRSKTMVLVTHQESIKTRGELHLTLEDGVLRPTKT